MSKSYVETNRWQKLHKNNARNMDLQPLFCLSEFTETTKPYKMPAYYNEFKPEAAHMLRR